MTPHIPTLSYRQHQILTLIAEGMTDKEIAHELGIVRTTVRKQEDTIFEQLGVQSRTAAAVYLVTEQPLIVKEERRRVER